MSDDVTAPLPASMEVRPTEPAPWSACAIAGFVCSLLGCLGVTSVAGLILGVVGLFRTSNGRRRGFGFAVAAIPLSLLSGIASGALLLVFLVGRQLVAVPKNVESILARIATEPVEAGAELRNLASADFNTAVSDDRLNQWFASLSASHGMLTSTFEPNGIDLTSGPNGEFVQAFQGKFVNGTVDIQVTFAPHSGFGKLTIDDIAVAGSSPRDPP